MKQDMTVKEINKKEAQDFFIQYEHLGNCGLGVWHYGLYNGDELISVVSFGATNFNPNRSSLGRIAKECDLKIIQLTRGGTKFDAPKNIPSYTISRAFIELKKRFGCCLIAAYSDTKWNEIGTIYQASNFLYLGLTNPKDQSNYVINGEVISGWMVRKKYGTRDIRQLSLMVDSIDKFPLTRKHFYVFPNTSKKKRKMVIKALQDDIQPYPKRKDLNVGSMVEFHRNDIIGFRQRQGSVVHTNEVTMQG